MTVLFTRTFPSHRVSDFDSPTYLLQGSAGKTSCLEVVFKGMPAKDTFFLDPTSRETRLDVNTIIPFQLWDCPGNHHVENLGAPLSAFSSLVYVIDLQDEYGHAVNHLIHLMAIIHETNRDLHIEVFAHKAENNFRQLQERVYLETIDHPLPLQDMRVTFHLTSVYDHTIFEAWSRVIQKLVKPLATLENLLNVLCSHSGLTKAFLFDVKTLIHVAADESPPDPTLYGLCCDYVQTIQQFSVLYKFVVIIFISILLS
ncbi:Gtr1/RagA G protein conserved region-domain-containing protein [Cantharellus anzutake]|uniref:Gtr1/RagA G protein conserved region-domain-containing protein n=1 Tax=Cantharellus anzutake TaxID=1750568 RepID=UPI0019052732|nr:Gtr1/RagA G protein conserved region-domain-containing protein [Cantharellus anzutake]KAF8340304.1 Gtr1/RagA G protein conserved region-domain-containing protein [Cantharellus anzutake]